MKQPSAFHRRLQPITGFLRDRSFDGLSQVFQRHCLDDRRDLAAVVKSALKTLVASATITDDDGMYSVRAR
jgi:hypothetical protein